MQSDDPCPGATEHVDGTDQATCLQNMRELGAARVETYQSRNHAEAPGG